MNLLLLASAVLASPIAWEHYWVAWFPVLLALAGRVRRYSSTLRRAALFIGAILAAGLSRPTLGAEGARLIRELSLMTWGGLVTCGCLAVLLFQDRLPGFERPSWRA